MKLHSKEVTFQSLDGLRLFGTLLAPHKGSYPLAVLVHGGGVDRNEDGFYVRLANHLAKSRIGSFRFDWRAHGKSEGSLEEMTLLGVVNDITAAVLKATSLAKKQRVHLVGTSFGGGLSAYFAARNYASVCSLVLLNPLLNYKRRLLEEKPFWKHDKLTKNGLSLLNSQGWLPHGSVFHMARPLLNELFHVHPYLDMANIRCPTLTIHGTKDSMVPFDVAYKYHKVTGESKFISIEGADHGFTLSGDEDYTAHETLMWQDQAISETTQWIVLHEDK